MLPIKIKVVLASTLVFGVLMTVFATIVNESLSDSEVAKLDARLESHAHKIQTEFEGDKAEPGLPKLSELDSLHTEGLAMTKIRLLTLEKDIVFADSSFDLDTHMKWNTGSAITERKAKVKIGHAKYRVQQWPVEINGKIQYLVQVASPMKDIESSLDHLTAVFFIVIPATLLLAGCVSFLIAAMAFRPMMKMVKTAEQISATNLHARLDLPRAHDEVHELGKALNEMIERIDDTIKGQRQFIADASHELRTPLTIIRSELEYVDRSTRHSSVKKSITISLTEVDRLSSMVNNLLMLAKLDAARVKLELSPLRLDELLLECVQATRAIAKKKGVKIEVFVKEVVEISGDHEKLKSVVLNLLDNAIKYSGKKSVVSASLLLNHTTPRTASITIRDCGIGVPKSEQASIFGRFYRGSQSRSKIDGSGLGLAIAQRFVEMHGGRISVESEEGKGSTFTVQLPLGRI
jgi:hypothetical protein